MTVPPAARARRADRSRTRFRKLSRSHDVRRFRPTADRRTRHWLVQGHRADRHPRRRRAAARARHRPARKPRRQARLCHRHGGERGRGARGGRDRRAHFGRHHRRRLGELRRRRAGQRHRQCRGRARRAPGRAVGHRRTAAPSARARSTATARSCSTPIRRSTPSTGSRGCITRSGSTPTGWASTSMSSRPTRRRSATSIMCIRSAHLGVRGDRRLAGRGGAGLPDARRSASWAWRWSSSARK